MSWKVTADTAKYEEACAWFAKRVPGIDIGKAEERARGTAFRVAGMMQLSAVQSVFDELKVALEKGTTAADFRKRIADKLGALAPGGALLETTFRNWTQRAYNAGRWEQMKLPENTRFRPYFMYDSLLDARTTEVCKVCNGTVKLHDDPWWLTHWPPMHHRCRSSVRNLRPSEAQRRGITIDDPAADADGTFGKAPSVDDGAAEHPDKAKLDPAVRAVFEQKEAQTEEALRLARERALKADPAYWMTQPFDYAYTDDVKARIAWGKAMEQRGLNMDIEKAERLFGELQAGALITESDMSQALFVGRRRGWISKSSKTLQDALDDLERTRIAEPESSYRIEGFLHAIRGGSALVGHMDSVARAAEGLKLGDVHHSVDFPSRADGKAKLDATKAFYGLLRDESVNVHTVSVNHSVNDRNGQPLRAFYDGVSKVHLAPSDGISTYVHEFAHAIEDSARMAKESGAFVDARTVGEPLQKLADLTGNPNYRADEMSKRDKFRDPYTAKPYLSSRTGEWAASEVMSMATQYIHEDASRVRKDDPELLWYALGQLAGKRSRP